jgi:S1-C subfamily serine protease
MTAAHIADAQKRASEWKPARQTQQAPLSPPPSKPPTVQTISGSGLFISENGKVVTNAHVVAGCNTVEVAFHDRAIAAPIIAIDSMIDLALLRLPQRSPAAARLRLAVRQGENVFAYGFPLAGLLSSGGNFTAGTVTALSGLRDDSRSLQISVPVQPGNSGGPLLDEVGNVVGVVVAKLDALKMARATDGIPQNVNFAIKATAVADFLSAHNVQYTEGTISPSIPPSEIAERARMISVHIECTSSP